MRTRGHTEPGDPTTPNEDWFGATDQVAVVLDGVTAPEELHTGCRHGVPWYVQHLGEALLRQAQDHDLREALRRAIVSTRSDHEATCDPTSDGTPSATVAACRVASDTFEVLVLSDATAVVDTGRELAVLTDKSLDGVAREQREALKREELGTPEHRAALLDVVREQRRWRNRAGGYWLAAALPEAADHATVRTWTRHEVRRAALMSDGVSCLVETYHATDWPNLLDHLHDAGPAAVVTRVRDVEHADANGGDSARYKASDDATIVSIARTDG